MPEKTIDMIIKEETQKIYNLDREGVEQYFLHPTRLTFHIDTAFHYCGVTITVVHNDASITVDTYLSMIFTLYNNEVKISPLLEPVNSLISEIYSAVYDYFKNPDQYVTIQGGRDEF